jgi:6-methylsalicylate decarboxylase
MRTLRRLRMLVGMTAFIDIHHHLLPPDLVEVLHAHGVRTVGGEALPTWNPELSLDIMDRVGIGRAVLSCPIPLHFLRFDKATTMARRINEYAAECASRWADRFGYFAVLPLPDVTAAVTEVAHALDHGGASGVVMLSNHAGVYQGDEALDPLYDELNRRRSVVFVHPTVFTGADYPVEPTAGSPISTIQPSQLEFGFDATRAMGNMIINEVPDRFPDIRFVFTHSGSCVPSVAHKLIDRKPMVAAYTTHVREHGQPPPVDDLLDQLTEAEHAARRQIARLYFDTALSTEPHVLAALTELVPTSHILLGTDFPFGQEIGLRYTLRGIERHPGLDVEQLTDNASELLALDRPATI